MKGMYRSNVAHGFGVHGRTEEWFLGAQSNHEHYRHSDDTCMAKGYGAPEGAILTSNSRIAGI